MATDDIKAVTSPLDLSLKVPNGTKSMTEDDYDTIKSFVDHKSVSSEELLSLKLLQDRLTKTMELLLPSEKSKKYEEIKKKESVPDFDYKTMRALLDLLKSENIDDPNPTSSLPNQAPHLDSWSYWHDYILSLYVMNSSGTSSLPPPPPVLPLSSSLFPAPFNFLPPSSNAILFQNMLTNFINTSSTKSQNDTDPRNFNPNLDFVLKSKKMNSYQFLKDSNLLYNSSRNLGLQKTKLLDSPESYGVSLRGNQKYSIYYQQRPNNVFNSTFISPACSSSNSSRSSYTNCNDASRKRHIPLDIGYKKTMLHKPMEQTDKPPKFQNFGRGTSHKIVDALTPAIHLANRYKETAFSCSCGQVFENLYAFTMHMKSTHHIPPNSSKIARSIPKLVRGQDMWINSETEQTKEILRCMRCHQSFRTLPELTMHMVETNHYSEIVYSDTGKCVFLNSDSDKLKPSYTTISSPISSPGDVARKFKRALSSSTGSDISVNEEGGKKIRLSCSVESMDCSTKSLHTEEVSLENPKITEADSESLSNSGKSVIKQIENFVEKSLPKSLNGDYTMVSSIFPSVSSAHKTVRSANKSQISRTNTAWKLESKPSVDSFSKPKKTVDDVSWNYPVSSTENVENPLSSLQSLVETIQKNTTQSALNQKVVTSQNYNSAESSSYSYSSKSPIICDSLSQLQALVAGTSVNTSTYHHQTKQSTSTKSTEKNKLFPANDIPDSSSTFISWCHRLGELLGLPHTLSQAMLTQDAIKDLANSVLTMNNDPESVLGNEEENIVNLTKDLSAESADSDTKSFQDRDSDPIEQLKNLLNSTSDVNPTNHSKMLCNKYLNGSSSSPPAISKKAKCHFCNKPFANKGQVRLHISKGKCPSLMRSCHSRCHQFETLANLRVSPVYKSKEAVINDSSQMGDVNSNSINSFKEGSTISNKSVNLIREYFKFAKQMISKDENNDNQGRQIENRNE